MTIQQQHYNSLPLSRASQSLLDQFLSDYQEELHSGTSIFFTQVLSPNHEMKKYPLKKLMESCVVLAGGEPEQSDLNVWCMRHANSLNELTTEEALKLSFLLRSSFKLLPKLKKRMFSRTVHTALQALPRMVCKMLVVLQEGDFEVRNVDCNAGLWDCACWFGPNSRGLNFMIPKELPDTAKQGFVMRYEKEEMNVVTYVKTSGNWEREY